MQNRQPQHAEGCVLSQSAEVWWAVKQMSLAQRRVRKKMKRRQDGGGREPTRRKEGHGRRMLGRSHQVELEPIVARGTCKYHFHNFVERGPQKSEVGDGEGKTRLCQRAAIDIHKDMHNHAGASCCVETMAGATERGRSRQKRPDFALKAARPVHLK